MMRFFRLCVAFIFSALIVPAAFAQSGGEIAELTINDISGAWRIEVIDRPNDDFKGSAMIPRSQNNSVQAEVITEDKCCGGLNHARVLQDSRITMKDGKILVESKIEKFLLNIQGTSATYFPDDFILEWQDANTLIGTANGYIPVRWVRDILNLS